MPDVFAAAGREPQAIYRHNEPVAVVVSPRDFAVLDARRADVDAQTLADAFAALRAGAGAGGGLTLPHRRGAR